MWAPIKTFGWHLYKSVNNRVLGWTKKLCVNVFYSVVGVGTQRSATRNQAWQMLCRDVYCRPRDHHGTFTGLRQQTHTRNCICKRFCTKDSMNVSLSGNHITGWTFPGSSCGRKSAALERWDASHIGGWWQNSVWGLQQLLPGHGQDLFLPGYVPWTQIWARTSV